jgi:hypothetical protein
VTGEGKLRVRFPVPGWPIFATLRPISPKRVPGSDRLMAGNERGPTYNLKSF